MHEIDTYFWNSNVVRTANRQQYSILYLVIWLASPCFLTYKLQVLKLSTLVILPVDSLYADLMLALVLLQINLLFSEL